MSILIDWKKFMMNKLLQIIWCCLFVITVLFSTSNTSYAELKMDEETERAFEQEEKARLHLVVAGTLDAITMVEA